MKKSLLLYLGALGRRPGSLVLLFFMAGLAAVLESSALVLLIPLIEVGVASGLSGGEGGAGTTMAVEALVHVLAFAGIPLTLPSLLLVFVVVAAGSVVTVWLSNVLIHRQIAATDAYMRQRLFNAVMRLDWPVLAGEKASEILKSMTSDPVQAGLGLFNLLLAGASLMMAIVYMTVAAMLSWKLTFLSALFGIVLIPAYLFLVRRGRNASEEASNLEAVITGEASQAVANAKLLFGQGLRERMITHYGDSIGQFCQTKMRQTTLIESSRLLFEVAAIIFVAIILLVLTVFEEWPISIGLVFVAIFYRLAPKIITVQGCLFRAVAHAAWIDDWRERVERFSKFRQVNDGALQPTFSDSLVLSDVSYAYPGASRPAVSDVSLKVRRGETVAFVGPSGHGKSTLLDLMTGLLHPQSGVVTIDGSAMNNVDVAAWQDLIGWVPQEAPLFHGTIRDNLVFFDRAEIDEGRLREACRIADAIEFIEELPKGLDTVVGERGMQISGGQRQRIALARALYRRPRLLILDEATSALDPETERRVISSLKQAPYDVTTIVVTHGKAPLTLADRVLLVRNGRVVEQPEHVSQDDRLR